jgi:hypothetical protein
VQFFLYIVNAAKIQCSTMVREIIWLRKIFGCLFILLSPKRGVVNVAKYIAF